jgi:hypothetical protein
MLNNKLLTWPSIIFSLDLFLQTGTKSHPIDLVINFISNLVSHIIFGIDKDKGVSSLACSKFSCSLLVSYRDLWTKYIKKYALRVELKKALVLDFFTFAANTTERRR